VLGRSLAETCGRDGFAPRIIIMSSIVPDLRLLRRSIKLARKLERIASIHAKSRALTLVGYGFLVRNRRLSGAIESLSPAYSYESLILIRTMLEIYINHNWIRLTNRHAGAVRFARYEPLDALKCIEEMPTVFAPLQFENLRKRLISQRAKARHLFRYRDKKTKQMHWARSWSSASLLETRLTEVRTSVPPVPIGNFLYGMYRWISSIVHGGAQSLSTVLTPTGPIKPKQQPLRDPLMPTWVAFVLLMSTVDLLADDLHATAALQPEFSRLMKRLRRPREIIP
jgi:hypothetical protein